MLIAHVDSDFVERDALEVLPPPFPRGPVHQPVPHKVLVGAIADAAMARGFQIRHQQFALGRQGQRLFGVMDLLPPEGIEQPADRGFSIGFRNSTDESLSIRMVAGCKVLVCDNLALSGDLIALNRRNTTGLDLPSAMAEAFDRYLLHAASLNEHIVELQRQPLSDAEAKARVVDIFVEKVMPLRLFNRVLRTYFHPPDDATDCQPRTAWGLHNACTRALKTLRPAPRFMASVALGQLFGLTRDGK
jgi:hypothetical protein